MKKHSLAAFESYLDSMNYRVFHTSVSIHINNLTHTSRTSFAAILYTGVPGRYVVAYKYAHMSVPYIERFDHCLGDCLNTVNQLLKL